MDRHRLLVAVVPLVLGLGCGPVVSLESDTGSGTDSSSGSDTAADPTPGESIDESGGGPSGPCGVGDTELIGGGPPGPLGFPPPCNPSSDPGTNGYLCCSDDPATVDGQLPAYQGMAIAGSAPLFAEANNALSGFGMCIDVGQLAGQGLLAPGVEGCPIPCNPTWPQDSIDAVCGPARVCCQTVELGPKDCVVDESSGQYRPVTGDDIGLLTVWRPSDHQTHQDPNGNDCLALAGGDTLSDFFQGCVRALGVANQRGFCMALGPGLACPDTVDACEQLNGG
jgi:hypothetical protein